MTNLTTAPGFQQGEYLISPPEFTKKIYFHKLQGQKYLETSHRMQKLILRPLDTSLRAIYNTKPKNDTEALQVWEYIETVLNDTRSLLLDSLSYTNNFRRQQLLKVILSNYTPPMDKDEVFGDELGSIIEKENSTNKLFDTVANSCK
ncbi:hypothetical protein F8M41_013140 [Gigaspora margarita]|uniref:Uncharacterized protein n=1 Tax=Gigaspora margarita TaxID=4874 RepID=A0A8H4A0J7_GIGMA|nr:hypothetical protein F8M41_013140 [Gigaspora margarita]